MYRSTSYKNALNAINVWVTRGFLEGIDCPQVRGRQSGGSMLYRGIILSM